MTNLKTADSSAIFLKTFVSGRSQRLRLVLFCVHGKRRSPHACVGADSGYGKYLSFRTQLREWNEPYILGVRAKALPVIPESIPIEELGWGSGRGRPPSEPRYPDDVIPQSAVEICADLDDED